MKCSPFALAALGLLAACGVAQADTIYRSSFEGTDGGWVATGDWARGVPSSPSTGCDTDNLTVLGAFDGTEVWATGLTSCYLNSGSFNTLTQTFDLSLSTNSKLSWQQGLSVFGNFDFVNVFVNGVSVYFYDSSTPLQPWQYVEVDLSAWDGNPSVEISFSLFATTVVNRPGWYIDDVHIEGDLPVPGVNYRLQIAASAPNSTPNVAACDVTFTATVTNVGLDNATGGGTFSAPLPGNANFVSGSGASLNMGNIQASIPALASGASHSFSFVLNANADGTMAVNGTVTTVDPDTNPSNNSATASVEVSSALPNDNCCAAENLNLQSFPYSPFVDNSLAFDGPDPGACNSVAVGRADFWYSYTAPANGVLSMTETGTQDIVWGLYTSCGDASPTCLATDTAQSVSLSMGQTVLIQVSAQTATTNITVSPTITFDFVTAPANDTCATAETIAFLPFFATAANLGATNSGDIGGCTNFSDVWYRWVATGTGSLRLNESGSQDAHWAVYEGSDCGGLVNIHCTTTDANQYPTVINGNTYYIRIGAGTATTSRASPLDFSVELFSPPPANDTCSTAEVIASLPFSTSVDNQSATNSGDVNGCTSFGDVWYQWTATQTGFLILNETGGQDAHWGVYEGAACGSMVNVTCTTTDTNVSAGVTAGQTYYIRIGAGTATASRATALAIAISFVLPGTNDFCSTAIDVTSSLPFTSSYPNSTAISDGFIEGCELFGDVWFSYTASQDGILLVSETGAQNAGWAVYSGTDCGVLTSVLCTLTDLNQAVPVTAGTTYKLRVGADTSATSRATPLAVSISFFTAPANDTCSTATVIDVLSGGSETVDARGASNDIDTDCNTTSATQTLTGVWYTFTTGPVGGVVNFNETSSADVVKQLFTGDCNFLSPVSGSCVDPDNSFHAVQPNTTYYMLMGQWSATTRPTVPYAFTYSFVPAPANDLCSGAVTLDVLAGGSETINAISASDDDDIECNGTSPVAVAGVWYTFTTGPDRGVVNINETSSATVATQLYAGSCGSLTTVPGSCSTAQNRFFSVEPNTTYYFIMSVSAATRPTVAYAFTYSFTPAPANDVCSGAEVLDIAFGGAATAFGTSATDDADIDCNGTSPVAVAGVWYTFTTPAFGGVLNVNETSTASVATQLYTGTCGSLTPVAGTCSTLQNRNFNLQPNTTYYMIMSMSAATRPTVAYAFTYSYTPATGGCCDSMDNCSIQTQVNCLASGGTYLGDFTNCFGDPQYESSNFIPIVDSVTNTDSIVVTDTTTITDFAVEVEFSHTFLGDVHLSISNGVTSAFLTRDSGGGNDVSGVYIFSDAGAVALPAAGNLPPSGVYRASQAGSAIVNLNALFGGQSVAGTWTLTAFDDATGDTGSVTRWGLVINGGVPVCDSGPAPCPGNFNGDGAVDLLDLLAFNALWSANLGQSVMPGTGADLNNDGTIDLLDLLAFNAAWSSNLGNSCP